MQPLNPQTVWLNVNKQCTFRCPWCYIQGSIYSPADDMPFELAKKLVIISHELRVENILFIGGEPTMWKHLLSLNTLCRQLGIKTTLVTNAMCFGNDKYWEKYLQSPNDAIGISIKAGSSDQFKEVTKANVFKKVRRGISRAINHCQCGVNATYNSYYRNTLPDLAQFAMDCGAKSFKIDFCSPVFIGGQASNRFMVEPEDLVADILRMYPTLKRITHDEIVFEMELPLCIWPSDFIEELIREQKLMTVCQLLKRRGLIFSTDGSLLLCNALFDFPVGKFGRDFSDAESLKNFLRSKTITSIYDRLSCYSDDCCSICDWYSYCGGGCPLRWAIYKPRDLVKPFTKGGKPDEEFVESRKTS